jgi:cytochrome c biogenesis protein CcmG, thiol:disulfide interchange protein DsbE
MANPHRAAAAAGLAVAALVSAGCGRAAATADSRNFSLPALREPGKTISLAAYAGRPVILTFFASWCPPCQQNTAVIARYYRAYHRQVTIIGIDSADQRSAARRLVRRDGVTFAVAADPTLGTASAYGAPGLPATYFLNAQHKVASKVLGPITWQQLSAGAAGLADAGAGAASPG